MKAIVQTRFGAPSQVLRFEDVGSPEPAENEVLVSVRAASVHIGDAHLTRGVPRIMRPVFRATRAKSGILGTDFSGVIERVGSEVSDLAPGAEVFGWCKGAFAEQVVASEEHVATKPDSLDFPEAAAIGVSAFTALQALRDRGRVQKGDKVLIVGASGGVGTFAVQMAKGLGAEVTGVCSGPKADMVAGLGADHIIDYTTTDFTTVDERYDFILDNVGDKTMRAARGVLAPGGRLLANGAPIEGWFGGLGRPAGSAVLSLFVKAQARPFVSLPNPADLATLRDMAQEGTIRPVIDRAFPLSEGPAAVAYVGNGHARGTTILTV